MSLRSGWCLPDVFTGRCHNHEECERRGGCDGCPNHETAGQSGRIRDEPHKARERLGGSDHRSILETKGG